MGREGGREGGKGGEGRGRAGGRGRGGTVWRRLTICLDRTSKSVFYAQSTTAVI